MAIDTAQKRWSMMNWGTQTAGSGVYVFPDGSDLDSKGQRQASMMLYSGIEFADPSGAISYGRHMLMFPGIGVDLYSGRRA